jgi:MSHA pilin protein MshD
MFTSKSQYGISLIELILFIVIISVALAALLSVLNITTQGSVNPLMRKQALSIAESLLEEVELQGFANLTVPPVDVLVGGTIATAIQGNRASFKYVQDYDNFATTGIYPADGSLTGVSGLSNYKVNVSIANAGTDFGIATNTDAVRITVTVKDLSDQIIIDAVGYRVNY